MRLFAHTKKMQFKILVIMSDDQRREKKIGAWRNAAGKSAVDFRAVSRCAWHPRVAFSHARTRLFRSIASRRRRGVGSADVRREGTTLAARVNP
jgi:hypothetical protein